MKEYCVDLELAKELKEKGFSQNTGFYWFRQDDSEFDTNGRVIKCKEWGLSFISYKTDKEWLLADFGHPDKWMGIQPEHFISAPTSDEILKELPTNIKNYHLTIFKDFYEDRRKPDFYCITYETVSGMRMGMIEENKLSNALAKMWLYLKKEGYIK